MSAQQSGPQVPAPPAVELDKIVASYFEKKGYKATQLAFLQESKGDTVSLEELAQHLKSIGALPSGLVDSNEEKNNPDAYSVSYSHLREWIDNSLDRYKPELRSVLFPVFVHAYLDLVSKGLKDKAHEFMEAFQGDHVELHTSDVRALAQVTESEHVSEHELAKLYRSNKYNLRMTSVPFELLLNYLQDNRYMLLLRIVNQYINIQVQDKLSKSAGGLDSADDSFVGITGRPSQQADEFNQQKVQLGKMPRSDKFEEQLDRALEEEDEADELRATLKKIKQEATQESPALGDIPMPLTSTADVQLEIDNLKDLAKRVALNSASLPSVCAYTFHNTHEGLNCVSFSDDATLVAGGFSESFIRIWSLKGEKLRGLKGVVDPTRVESEADLDRQREPQGSDYKRLIGHAGPVFGMSFSQDNKYLISCAEDKTARLWSMDTFSNLAVYKGHNHPVWDIDFGPYGFYFATASHDRTARLWSCDHIHPLRIFAGHLSDVDTVKFHPNSKYLVTGSGDRTARLWDVQRGTCVRVFTGHTGGVNAVAVSPNGRLMASAGEDKAIHLWDLGSGKLLKAMTGHTGYINSIDFSADSNVLVSGSADNTVRVWDVNRDTPNALQVVEDGKRMRIDQEKENERHKKDRKDKDKQKTDKRRKHGVVESNDHLASFPTKQTPIYTVKFTRRNLCLVAGAYCPVKY